MEHLFYFRILVILFGFYIIIIDTINTEREEFNWKTKGFKFND